MVDIFLNIVSLALRARSISSLLWTQMGRSLSSSQVFGAHSDIQALARRLFSNVKQAKASSLQLFLRSNSRGLSGGDGLSSACDVSDFGSTDDVAEGQRASWDTVDVSVFGFLGGTSRGMGSGKGNAAGMMSGDADCTDGAVIRDRDLGVEDLA